MIRLDLLGRSVLERGRRALPRSAAVRADSSDHVARDPAQPFEGFAWTSREALAVLVIGLSALLVRWTVLAGEPFPVNDGGLFATMIDERRAADFALPTVTNYNQLEIPFAYPPLPFYLGAAIAEWSPLSTTDVLRLMPLIVSTLTIVPVYLLSRRLLRNSDAALLATFLFALTPRAFNWEIMGGGLTRSLGLLFAACALTAAFDMFEHHRWRATALTAVFTALAALSHLEMAAFVASSGVLFYLALDRSRAGLSRGLIVGVIATILTAPWWGTVLARHGLDPFVAASEASQWSPLIAIRLLTLTFTDSPLIDLVAVFGFLGFFIALRQRAWLLPAWVLLIFLLDPRKAATLAVLPTAMLAAIALTQVIVPAIAGRAEDDSTPSPQRLAPRAPAIAFAITITLMMVLNAVLSGSVVPSLEASATQPLHSSEREAFAWIAEQTAPGSSFAILAGANNWPSDRASEWFPALTGRRSVATVQGTEWLPNGAFEDAIDRYQSLQRCGEAGLDCLLAWEAEYDQQFSHVLLHGRPGTQFIDDDRSVTVEDDCCGTLREQLTSSRYFHLVYSNDSIWVFERTPDTN
jgi:hypothetical protein